MKYDTYWEIMRGSLDDALKHAWENMSEAGVSAAAFYRSHKMVLAMFADESDLSSIFESKDRVNECPDAIRRVAHGSAIGSSMFKTDILKVGRKNFQDMIVSKLSDLQHLDFENVGLEGFKQAMMQETVNLSRMGAKPFERVVSVVRYLGVDLKIPMESLNDEWEFRLAAAVKSDAVSAGHLPMLPWEELAYAVRGVPHARAYGKVPEELLAQFSAARDAMRDWVSDIGGERAIILKDMQRIVAPRVKQLRQLDRTIDLDLHFLEHAVEGIIREKNYEKVIASLPTPDAPVTLKQALC